MAKIEEVRRNNLRYIIDKHHGGTDRQLAVALGKQDNSINRYFAPKDKGGRNIGRPTCDQIEKLHHLPEGWMDEEHDHTKSATGAFLDETQDLDNEDLRTIFSRAVPRLSKEDAHVLIKELADRLYNA